MVRWLLSISIVVFSLSLVGCKEEYEDLGRTPTNGKKAKVPQALKMAPQTKLQKVQGIFNSACVSCHSAARPLGSLNLQAGATHGSLVGRKSSQSALKLVAPGDLNASYLIHKLRGTHLTVGGSGQAMPTPRGFGPSRLPKKSMTVIEDWVKAGAPEN